MQGSVALPDQSCDLTITEKIELSCGGISHPWREGTFLASTCEGGVWWLQPEAGDWSPPDRLLGRKPSQPKSAPPRAALSLSRPPLSNSTHLLLPCHTPPASNL